jgi:Domain of unknown function (DUF5666)
MNRQFSRIGLAAALCSSLFLAGCDDDDDDNGNPTTPSSPAPVQPSPSPSPSASPSPSPSPGGGTTQPGAGQRTSFLGRFKDFDGTTARIGGQRVTVTSTTIVDRGGAMIAATDLQRDELVRVRGIVESDGDTIRAEKITVQLDDNDDNNDRNGNGNGNGNGGGGNGGSNP